MNPFLIVLFILFYTIVGIIIWYRVQRKIKKHIVYPIVASHLLIFIILFPLMGFHSLVYITFLLIVSLLFSKVIDRTAFCPFGKNNRP
jgi:hypothetical protein